MQNLKISMIFCKILIILFCFHVPFAVTERVFLDDPKAHSRKPPVVVVTGSTNVARNNVPRQGAVSNIVPVSSASKAEEKMAAAAEDVIVESGKLQGEHELSEEQRATSRAAEVNHIRSGRIEAAKEAKNDARKERVEAQHELKTEREKDRHEAKMGKLKEAEELKLEREKEDVLEDELADLEVVDEELKDVEQRKTALKHKDEEIEKEAVAAKMKKANGDIKNAIRKAQGDFSKSGDLSPHSTPAIQAISEHNTLV